MMKKFLWFLAVLSLCPLAVLCQTNDAVQLYKGRLADQPVTAKLKIKDGQISGTYSYDKTAKEIPVKGTIGSDGKLKIEEFAGGLRKPATAIFTGERYEKYSPTTRLAGDFQKNGKKNSEHFFLHAVNLGENVRVSPKSIIEKTKSYTINITYPEFSGAADYSKLNAFVLQTINDKVREFKTGEHGRDCAENVKGGGRACSLTGEYSVVHMSPELVSLAYSDNLDLGGAHGTPADHAINFDLKNGKPVQLADVFKPGADYLKTIAAYSISELKKFEGFKDHPQTVEEGAAPKAENYQTWFLSPKGLIVGFAAYQVGAYAYGTPYVTIPFSELRDAMKTDGVAANLMK
jgi:hypothetical protein